MTKEDLFEATRPLALFLLFAAPTTIMFWFLVRFKDGRLFFIGGYVGLAYWVAMGVLLVLIVHRRRHQRRRARRLEAGLCPHCTYNLTGLPEPRCPECGTEFDPGLLDQL